VLEIEETRSIVEVLEITVGFLFILYLDIRPIVYFIILIY